MCDLKYFCLNIILLGSSIILLGVSCTNQVINYRANIPFNDISFILGFILIAFSVDLVVFELVQYIRMWKSRRRYDTWGDDASQLSDIRSETF